MSPIDPVMAWMYMELTAPGVLGRVARGIRAKKLTLN